MRANVTLVLALLACSGPLIAADREPRSITGTSIKAYGGNWFTVPQAINNRGEIAGYALQSDDVSVVFVRSSSGRYQRIADRGFVFDMNDTGEVVGILFVPVDETITLEGFVWSRRRGLQRLGSFLPFAINNRGDMAGVCEPPADAREACVLRHGLVSTIPNGAEALGINRTGTVVGTYGDNRAFLLTKAWEFMDVGRAVAQDINNHGVIAGHQWLQVPNRGERAVVTAWTRRGPRSPGDVGLGLAINEPGWLISIAWRVADDGFEEPYSFAWNAMTGARVSLKSKTGGFVSPEAINDHGVIVGTADGRPTLWRLRKGGSR